jgi:hypothetical protein
MERLLHDHLRECAREKEGGPGREEEGGGRRERSRVERQKSDLQARASTTKPISTNSTPAQSLKLRASVASSSSGRRTPRSTSVRNRRNRRRVPHRSRDRCGKRHHVPHAPGAACRLPNAAPPCPRFLCPLPRTHRLSALSPPPLSPPRRTPLLYPAFTVNTRHHLPMHPHLPSRRSAALSRRPDPPQPAAPCRRHIAPPGRPAPLQHTGCHARTAASAPWRLL